MIIKGYKKVDYFDFITKLREYRGCNKKSNPQLAVELEFRASQTIVNSLNIEKQAVKDSNLTKLMQCLGFDGFILWRNGEKGYYVSNKIM